MQKFISIFLISFAFLGCNKPKTARTIQLPQEVDDQYTTSNAQQHVLEKAWQTDTIFATPESVLAHQGVLYVSNVGGKNPLAKDGNGFISKLNPKGEVISLDWAKGLDAPKGMAVLGQKLYVTDIDRLVEIDLETGAIAKQYKVDGAIFLNDVTVKSNTKSSSVYFSDMKTGKIHELKEGVVSVFVEGLEAVNGLYAQPTELLCLTGAGFQSVNYSTKQVSTITQDVQGGDGIEKTSTGDYVVSKWKGQVYLVTDSGAQLLLDTQNQGTQTADIGYLAKENLVLVPTFFGNRVVAYHLY